jgi:hypothetical protein
MGMIQDNSTHDDVPGNLKTPPKPFDKLILVTRTYLPPREVSVA